MIRVYDKFDTKEELINWLKNYPAGPIRTYENDDESDIVVMVTLPKYDKEHTRQAEKIFKGLKIIYVESSGVYYSSTVADNVGFKEALKHKPRWIIYANDDIEQVDDISVLEEGLESVSKSAQAVFRSDYKKVDGKIISDTFTHVMGKTNFIYRDFGALLPNGYNKEYLKLTNKFGVNLMAYSKEATLGRKLYNIALTGPRKIRFYGWRQIYILNSRYVKEKKGKVFDEVYRSCMDDTDLHFSIYENDVKYDFVNFNIEPLKGGGLTLGKGLPRAFRNIANAAYFCEKWKNAKKLKELM